MQLTLVTLALSAQILSTVVALPAEANKPAKPAPTTQALPAAKDIAKSDAKGPDAANVKGPDATKGGQSKPIDLEMGKDYTAEGIQAMFTKQAAGTFTASAVTAPKKDTKPVSVAVEKGMMESSAISTPVNMMQMAVMTYSAVCWSDRYTRGNFDTKVTFDGKQAHWTRGLNVDSIGPVTMTGSRGKPLVSTAELRHIRCKAVAPTVLCSFYHSLSVKATIDVLGTKRIVVSAIQQDDPDVAKRSYVIQTCKTITPGYKGPCPAPDLKGPRCYEGQIAVINAT